MPNTGDTKVNKAHKIFALRELNRQKRVIYLSDSN